MIDFTERPSSERFKDDQKTSENDIKLDMFMHSTKKKIKVSTISMNFLRQREAIVLNATFNAVKSFRLRAECNSAGQFTIEIITPDISVRLELFQLAADAYL